MRAVTRPHGTLTPFHTSNRRYIISSNFLSNSNHFTCPNHSTMFKPARAHRDSLNDALTLHTPHTSHTQMSTTTRTTTATPKSVINTRLARASYMRSLAQLHTKECQTHPSVGRIPQHRITHARTRTYTCVFGRPVCVPSVCVVRMCLRVRVPAARAFVANSRELQRRSRAASANTHTHTRANTILAHSSEQRASSNHLASSQVLSALDIATDARSRAVAVAATVVVVVAVVVHHRHRRLYK